MATDKLPKAKEKQTINTRGLSDLAKQVREILIKEDKYAQKEVKGGTDNLSKLNYAS